MSKTKKKVTITKKYVITLKEYNDNTSLLKRKNDGFTSLELLGLLEQIQFDILKQIAGVIKPDKIKRKFIED